MARTRTFDTDLIHGGEPRPRIEGAVVVPIFQSSTFEMAEATGYHDIRYLRLSNTPNHDALHHKIALLEATEAALVASSGMAAISTTFLSLLAPGDHLIAQRGLYGGTHDFVTQDLVALGVEHTFVPGDDPAAWRAALRPTTRVFHCEAMSNPLLEVGDLRGVARFAREHGLVSTIDSTFATPMNFRAAEHGFDLVLHSATKYLNGHSDLVAGVVAGSRELVSRVRVKLNHLGGSLDPHACFLLHRGMKTLAVRMRQHNETGLTVARALAEERRVSRVHYPGLATHPSHARAKELFSGYGGMVSFEIRGEAAEAQAVIDALELFAAAPSLGGVESLVTRPSTTSHAGMPAEERRALGIGDGLVRLSLGLEGADDLVADLARALRG